jgi:tetratricopeptide (TPR) repeat protein
MKKIILIIAIAIITTSSYAQLLPKPSPTGKTTQIVGVTEVTLEYSRPGAKERVVFGELVPYDELWRFGANSCTKITTDEILQFSEGDLKPGTYAVFAIPGESGVWEIIFNSDTDQGGTGNYSKDKDVLRVTAKANDNSYTETFTLDFGDITTEGAKIVILWEKLRVEIPFKVSTTELAKRNIDKAIALGENLESVYNNAASFYFNTLKDFAGAMTYVDKSIKLEKTYGNLFTKARILEKQGEKAKAIKMAEESLAFAKENASTGYIDYIAGTIEDWKK